ncbi:MAG TPA: hypothetical protein VF611_18910, partial [Pyrinomonadaceae bacterium]
MDEIIANICARQSPGGAFLSTVRLPFGDVEDRNCFVTGLVLREIAAVRGRPAVDEARRRAFGFLQRSKYPVYPYLFSFYPHRSHPFWMRSALYADADDTSVIVPEMVRAGLLPAESMAYVAENYLLKYRAAGDFGRHLTEPWHREGVFLTWFTSADIENPIDCCVNTNVVGLLAAAGLRGMEGYAAACAMINEAAEQAAGRPEGGRRFTPYYPHPAEWFYALERAVEAGARELLPALEAL